LAAQRGALRDGTLFAYHGRQPVPFSLAPDNLLTTFDRGRSNTADSYALGDTWLVSPQTVVSSRLVANYTNIQRLGAEFFNYGDLGVKNYYSYQPKYLQLSVTNPGFNLGGGTANTSTYRTFSSGLNIDATMTEERTSGPLAAPCCGSIPTRMRMCNPPARSPSAISFTTPAGRFAAG